MTNILDYLATEFRTFEQEPFNVVDSLILSQFSMVSVDGIVDALQEPNQMPNEATGISHKLRNAWHSLRGLGKEKEGVLFRDLLLAERYSTMFNGLVPGRVKELLFALASNPRYRTMRVCHSRTVFDEESATQFAAMSFVQDSLFSYVGFRGTDSSFTGWREDFNMAYMDQVPSQRLAVQYLEDVIGLLPGTVYVGGHSKGGNLAAYALAKASDAVFNRVQLAFNHDGPGFCAGALSEREEGRLQEKMHKTVPQDSVIGMLLDNSCGYSVVTSNAKGIDQHNPFTWEVDGTTLIGQDALTSGAAYLDKVLDEWMSRYDRDEKKILVDVMFDCMESTGADTFLDMITGSPKTISYLKNAATQADDRTKRVLLDAVGALSGIALRSVFR